MAEDEEKVIGNVDMYTVTFNPPYENGMFGTVFKAVHKTTNKLVAAKRIIIGDSDNIIDDMQAMAKSEVQIMTELKNHPNIVEVYESTIKKNVCWLFMEFCDLGNLKGYITSKKEVLPMRDLLEIMRQCSSALVFMHNQNPPIFHRDIKPQNILMKRVAGIDVVKIADFGVSKIYVGQQSLTEALGKGHEMDSTCGSPYFMAPEFFAHNKGGTKYGSSIDVFSLGLVFLVLEDRKSMPDMVPLSVLSRKNKTSVAIGKEMVICYKEKKPMPKVIETGEIPTKGTKRRLQRIIDNMTRFSPRMRKNVDEVEAELIEMIESLCLNEELQRSMKNMVERNEHYISMYEQDRVTLEKCLRQIEGQTNRDYLFKEKIEESVCHLLKITCATVSTPKDGSDSKDIGYECRPEKIMEEFNLFCTQEWLDATSVLCDFEEEQSGDWDEANSCIFLSDCMTKCTTAAEKIHQMAFSAIEDLQRTPILPFILEKLNITTDRSMPSQELREQLLIVFRRSSRNLLLEELSKEICHEQVNTKHGLTSSMVASLLNHHELIKFLVKCLSICWKMALQRPPMQLVYDPAPGGKFDQKKHKLYFGSIESSKSRAVIHYYVHPALFLGEFQMKKAQVVLHVPDLQQKTHSTKQSNADTSCAAPKKD